MTAPQQAPVPPEPQVAETRPPVPAAPEPQGAWPPDDETLMQLQMDARFSIIEEPAGEQTSGADRQETPPAGTTPPPQPERQG